MKADKNKISEDKIHEIWTLMDAGFSQREISSYTGISAHTIQKYGMFLKAGIHDPIHTPTTEKVLLCIQHGYKLTTIRSLLGIRDEKAFERILEEIGYSDSDETFENAEDLLKKWHWKRPKGKQKRISDNGYRIVYVGEKSDFRTLYRPDGRWF